MTDWPLLLFLACGGAVILLIGLMSITDLDSFFAAMATVIDGAAGLSDLIMDWIDALSEGAPEAPPEAPPPTGMSEEGMMLKEAK